MERHFLDLMPHTITLEPVSDYSSAGVETYGDAVEARALVTPERQRIVAASGQEVIARGVAYCAGPLTLDEDWAITVPAAFGLPERMPVLRATPYAARDGSVHNVEVWF